MGFTADRGTGRRLGADHARRRRRVLVFGLLIDIFPPPLAPAAVSSRGPIEPAPFDDLDRAAADGRRPFAEGLAQPALEHPGREADQRCRAPTRSTSAARGPGAGFRPASSQPRRHPPELERLVVEALQLRFERLDARAPSASFAATSGSARTAPDTTTSSPPREADDARRGVDRRAEVVEPLVQRHRDARARVDADLERGALAAGGLRELAPARRASPAARRRAARKTAMTASPIVFTTAPPSRPPPRAGRRSGRRRSRTPARRRSAVEARRVAQVGEDDRQAPDPSSARPGRSASVANRSRKAWSAVTSAAVAASSAQAVRSSDEEPLLAGLVVEASGRRRRERPAVDLGPNRRRRAVTTASAAPPSATLSLGSVEPAARTR